MSEKLTTHSKDLDFSSSNIFEETIGIKKVQMNTSYRRIATVHFNQSRKASRNIKKTYFVESRRKPTE